MRRRRRMKTDWVIAHWDEAEGTITGGNFLLLDLLSQSDLEEKNDRMTLQRLIGTFECRCADIAATPASLYYQNVWVRIFKGDERTLQAGAYTIASGAPFNPHLNSNADDEFLFQRKIPMSPADTDGSRFQVFFESPWWGNWDIRVKRRLRNEERIIMTIHPFLRDAGGTDLALNYLLHLRALVSF